MASFAAARSWYVLALSSVMAQLLGYADQAVLAGWNGMPSRSGTRPAAGAGGRWMIPSVLFSRAGGAAGCRVQAARIVMTPAVSSPQGQPARKPTAAATAARPTRTAIT